MAKTGGRDGGLTAPTPKHYTVAAMMLVGLQPAEIAKLTGLAVRSVETMFESPLFRALADRLRHGVREELAQEASGKIVEEGPRSVDKLATLRDAAVSEFVQLGAARDLLDRNPSTSRYTRAHEEKNVNVTISGELLARAVQAIAEDDGRAISAVATPLGAVPVMTLEEALAAAREAGA